VHFHSGFFVGYSHCVIDRQQNYFPVTLSGRYIHVPSFARFDDTLSVIEKTSALTLVTTITLAERKAWFSFSSRRRSEQRRRGPSMGVIF